jgi:hypothetical protein
MCDVQKAKTRYIARLDLDITVYSGCLKLCLCSSVPNVFHSQAAQDWQQAVQAKVNNSHGSKKPLKCTLVLQAQLDYVPIVQAQQEQAAYAFCGQQDWFEQQRAIWRASSVRLTHVTLHRIGINVTRDRLQSSLKQLTVYVAICCDLKGQALTYIQVIGKVMVSGGTSGQVRGF